MPVKLNSSGGGSVTLTTPSTATDYTATFPAATGSVVLSNTSGTATVTDFYATNVYASGTVQMGSSFKRNFIINGDMRVNQRAAASYTATGYTVDRFYLYNNTQPYAAQGTSSPPSGFTTYLRVGRQSGATNTGTVNFVQALETLNSTPLAGQTVTFSFYAKAGANFSAASNTIVVAVNSGTGTDQSAASFGAWTGNAAVTSGSPSLTTSWVRYTYTGTVSSSATQVGFLVYFTPVGTAGADDTFYITGVQLEVGSVATPYERQIYSEQLAQCQRYCFKGTLYDLGRATDSTYPSNLLLLPVTMRSTPSFTAANGSYTVNAGSSGTPGYLFSSPNTVFLYNSASNWTATAFVQFTGFVTAEL